MIPSLKVQVKVSKKRPHCNTDIPFSFNLRKFTWTVNELQFVNSFMLSSTIMFFLNRIRLVAIHIVANYHLRLLWWNISRFVKKNRFVKIFQKKICKWMNKWAVKSIWTQITNAKNNAMKIKKELKAKYL